MKKIMKNLLFFSLIYFLFSFLLILYYSLTNEKELFYPVLMCLFFYFVYVSVSIGYYLIYMGNMKKLEENSFNCFSFNTERQKAYDTINIIHKKYNEKMDYLEREQNENRRFVSACVHNLKTPITVSNLIIQRALNKEINEKEAFNDLFLENEKMHNALNLILDTQRLEEFAKDYTPLAMNIKEEIQKAINDNKRLFINAKMYPVIIGDEKVVLSDRKWNRVLITQIISNAVKYAYDAEDRNIYFGIEEKGDKTILSITDKGIGIPECDLKKVFEPFFTGENGRKSYSSSGIGLYLCKMICDKLNQKIEIENKGGTTVKITYLTKM